MMRSVLGLSFSLVLGVAGGCSSKAVNDDAETTAGSGGSGTTAGSGGSGTTAGSGGSGITAGGGGSGTTAGSGGSGTAGSGGTGPACPTMCLDDMTAQYCDATGAMQTANCAEVFAEDGLISNGCLSDAEGDGCTLDDFEDMACIDGAIPFAFCAGLTADDVIDVYVGCFRDMNGAHAVIPCYADFLGGTEEMPTVDCEMADLTCLPEP